MYFQGHRIKGTQVITLNIIVSCETHSFLLVTRKWRTLLKSAQVITTKCNQMLKIESVGVLYSYFFLLWTIDFKRDRQIFLSFLSPQYFQPYVFYMLYSIIPLSLIIIIIMELNLSALKSSLDDKFGNFISVEQTWKRNQLLSALFLNIFLSEIVIQLRRDK